MMAMTNRSATYKGLASELETALDAHREDAAVWPFLAEFDEEIAKVVAELRSAPYPDAVTTPVLRSAVDMYIFNIERLVSMHRTMVTFRGADRAVAKRDRGVR